MNQDAFDNLIRLYNRAVSESDEKAMATLSQRIMHEIARRDVENATGR